MPYKLNTTIHRIFSLLFWLSLIPIFASHFFISHEIIFGIKYSREYFFQGATLVMLVITILAALSSKKPFKFHLNYGDIAILVYQFWIVSRILLSVNPASSVDAFIDQTLLLAFYFIMKGAWKNRQDTTGYDIFQVLTVVIMLSGLGQALWGLLQLYGFSPSYNRSFQVTGSFVNPAPFSFYLAMIFPLALSTYLSTQKDLKLNRGNKVTPLLNTLAAVTMVLILLILPVTLIRTSWLMTISGSIIVLYFAYQEDVSKVFRKYKKVILVGISLLLLIGSFGLYILKKDSANGRLFIYQVTIEKALEAPLFGHGYRSFSASYNEWQADWFAAHPEEINSEKAYLAGSVKFAYNEYLELWVENGLIGLLMILVASYFFLKGILARIRQRKLSKQVIPALAVTVALLTGALFSYPLYMLSGRVFLMLFLAVISANVEQNFSFKLSQWLIKPLGIIILVLSIYAATKLRTRYLALKEWKEANYLYAVANYDTAVASYVTIYDQLKYFDGFSQQYAKALSMKGEYKKSNDILLETLSNGSDAFSYITLGDNYKALDENIEAEKMYQRAHLMNPSALFPEYLLAKLYHDTGQSTKALKQAKKVYEKHAKVNSTAVEEIREEMKKIIDVK